MMNEDKETGAIHKSSDQELVRAIVSKSKECSLGRFDAGRMSVEEVDNLVRAHLFGALDIGLELLDDARKNLHYETDMRCSGACTGTTYEYVYSPYNGPISEDQWLIWRFTEEMAQKHDLQAFLLLLKTECDWCSASFSKLVVRLTANLGTYLYHQEYVLPGDPVGGECWGARAGDRI